jgi:hypothetical protein
LQIPFDGEIDTPNYKQFIEYLETIGHYGKLHNPTTSVNDWFNDPELLQFALETKLIQSYGDPTIDSFYLTRNLENFISWSNKPTNDLINPDWLNSDGELDFDEWSDGLGLYEDDWKQKVLTPEGQRMWPAFARIHGKGYLSSFIEYNLHMNDSGQIQVEREITIPKANNHSKFPQYQRKDGEQPKDLDYYEFLTNNMCYGRGIGVCWAYSKGAAESYNADPYGPQGGCDTITMYGWVNPESVDVKTSLELEIMDECELRLKASAPVQIDRIVMRGTGKNLLKSPIVVPA